uniref:Pept_C1 domain-containing protein n=1 Tax=Rhabditophanes sp. KR3021 TaxID=114890 RepID=A0AC35TVU6_9BILA
MVLLISSFLIVVSCINWNEGVKMPDGEMDFVTGPGSDTDYVEKVRKKREVHNIIPSDGWNHFKANHDREYHGTKDELVHELEFLNKESIIKRHNARYARGETTFLLGPNGYEDLTFEEFQKLHGFKPTVDSLLHTNKVPDVIHDLQVKGMIKSQTNDEPQTRSSQRNKIFCENEPRTQTSLRDYYKQKQAELRATRQKAIEERKAKRTEFVASRKKAIQEAKTKRLGGWQGNYNPFFNNYYTPQYIPEPIPTTPPPPSTHFTPVFQQLVHQEAPPGLPSYKNWTAEGYVNKVRMQGDCGCCYIIAAVQTLEAYVRRKFGYLIELSVQEVIDCWGGGGCDGGQVSSVFEYLKTTGGINTEQSYPFSGEKDTCKAGQSHLVGGFTSFVKLPNGNETALMEALVKYGPISISMYAGLATFQQYKGGVYYDPNCEGKVADHSMLLVAELLHIRNKRMADYIIPSDEWLRYKDIYHKHYANKHTELIHELEFLNKQTIIERHNSRYFRGETTFMLGRNPMEDMTYAEFDHMHGFHPDLVDQFKQEEQMQKYVTKDDRIVSEPLTASSSLPAYVNWTADGLVTPVKDQQKCDCCFIFAAVQALEGYLAKKTGKLVQLSIQEVIDCFPEGTCEDGGVLSHVFDYLQSSNGTSLDDGYSYQAKKGQCHKSSRLSQGTFKEYVKIKYGDEKALEEAVAKYGPVAVSIHSMSSTFQMYKSGVYFEPNCHGKEADHSVLVVGYGTDQAGGDWWLIKNTWGTSWGMNGYMKLSRNKNNHCSIASWPRFIKN